MTALLARRECAYGACSRPATIHRHGFPLCSAHALDYAPDGPVVVAFTAAGSHRHPLGALRHAVILDPCGGAPPATRTGQNRRALCLGRVTYWQPTRVGALGHAPAIHAEAGDPFDPAHPRACAACARVLKAAR